MTAAWRGATVEGDASSRRILVIWNPSAGTKAGLPTGSVSTAHQGGP